MLLCKQACLPISLMLMQQQATFSCLQHQAQVGLWAAAISIWPHQEQWCSCLEAADACSMPQAAYPWLQGDGYPCLPAAATDCMLMKHPLLQHTPGCRHGSSGSTRRRLGQCLAATGGGAGRRVQTVSSIPRPSPQVRPHPTSHLKMERISVAAGSAAGQSTACKVLQIFWGCH